jgi:hypothetical protein
VMPVLQPFREHGKFVCWILLLPFSFNWVLFFLS